MENNLTFSRMVASAGAISVALVVAAMGFQAMGYAPCDLCIIQRWPHMAAAVIAAATISLHGGRAWAWAGAVAAALATALAFYHAGVEWRFWPGPSSCTSAAQIAGLSVQELMQQIEAAPITRCDEVAWRFLGLSMAAWNALISAGLTVLWLAAARQATRVRY